jgi:hypothetical protein
MTFLNQVKRLGARRQIIYGFAVLLAIVILYKSVVNYLDPGEAGLTWNPISGEIGIQDHAGFQINAPWVFVTTIDTRPRRLCLISSAHSAPNCKLVSFDTRYYKQFIAVEGWRWYWWSNRFSFNSGYDRTYRGFDDILRGYAFSAQPYPFVKVHSEYE